MLNLPEMTEFYRVRLGVDSFYCCEGYFLVGFTIGMDASSFSDHARRTTRMFSEVLPASFEDLEYAVNQGALLAQFTSSAFDGWIVVALDDEARCRCSDEEGALIYIADQMSLGWGTEALKFLT